MESNASPTRSPRRAAALWVLVGLAIGATATRWIATSRNGSALAAPSLDRAELAATIATALAPIEAQLRVLTELPLALPASRSADERASDTGRGDVDAIDSDPHDGLAVDPAAARIERLLARCEERLAQFAAAPWNLQPDGALEEQLAHVRRDKDLGAIERAYDELDRAGCKAITASYALLGPRTIADRFGAPDSVGGSGGKTWWYWRLDDERSLGVAFANGLVCDVDMP